MTASDIAAVLALTKSMAEERGWARVGDYLSGLPSRGDDDILVLVGEGVRAEPLADWIAAAVRGARVSTGPLAPLRDDPAVALAANRVVMVFQCGRLLTAEGVEAATGILSRPAESYAIVFLGAESIRDQDELNLLEQGIWRVLVGEAGVRWAGQDLAERQCLLWSEAEAADAVAERVARDRALLEKWLRSPVTASEELAGLRADHALQLAEQEIAMAASDARAEGSAARAARLRAARVSLESLHRRLLGRLDDDAASVERQITSSLELLQQDLLREIRLQLDRRGNRLRRDGDGREDVQAVIGKGMRGWRAETEAMIVRRARRTGDETSDLLDGVDWDLVNEVSAAHGGASYPGVILERIRTPAELALTIDEPTAGPGPRAPSTPGGWASALRIAGCAAALAAVAAIFTPLTFGPVVAVGAAGAMGGGLVNRYASAASSRRAAMAYAQAAVSQVKNTAFTTVRQQLRQATMPMRREIAANFRDIEDALHAAALKEAAAAMPGGQPQADGGQAEGPSDEARLADMRQRLARARAGSSGTAADGEH